MLEDVFGYAVFYPLSAPTVSSFFSFCCVLKALCFYDNKNDDDDDEEERDFYLCSKSS